MASASLTPLITPEHFSVDPGDFLSAWERRQSIRLSRSAARQVRSPFVPRPALEQCIEAAIDGTVPLPGEAIDTLIDLLDAIDRDPDLEPTGDEIEDSEALQPGVTAYGRLLDNVPLRLGMHEDDELPGTPESEFDERVAATVAGTTANPFI